MTSLCFIRSIVSEHFVDCGKTPTESDVRILGRERGERLLTLEALFINSIKPSLNSKDEFRSRVLKSKF